MNANKLSFGLFMFRGSQWWRNLKDIPIFFSRIFFTLKHGYSPVATFETFEWFIAVIREVLTFHRYNRMGTPIVIEDYFGENDEENEAAYNIILDEMLSLLNEMDEDNSDYKKNAAKDKFFKLFSEHFYELWD